MFIELSGTDELFTVLLVSAAGRLETTRLAKLLKLFLCLIVVEDVCAWWIQCEYVTFIIFK